MLFELVAEAVIVLPAAHADGGVFHKNVTWNVAVKLLNVPVTDVTFAVTGPPVTIVQA